MWNANSPGFELMSPWPIPAMIHHELISDILLLTASHGWPKQDDQLESIYSDSVPIQNVALKTYRKWWKIEKGGERGSGIYIYIYIYIYIILSWILAIYKVKWIRIYFSLPDNKLQNVKWSMSFFFLFYPPRTVHSEPLGTPVDTFSSSPSFTSSSGTGSRLVSSAWSTMTERERQKDKETEREREKERERERWGNKKKGFLLIFQMLKILLISWKFKLYLRRSTFYKPTTYYVKIYKE